MNKYKSLARQVRELRLCGMPIYRRARKLAIKNAAGFRYEENAPGQGSVDDLYVSRFFCRALIELVCRTFTSEQPVTSPDGSEAFFKTEEISFRISAHFKYVFILEVLLFKEGNVSVRRELPLTTWPHVDQLHAFIKVILADYRKLLLIGTYLESHTTKIPFTFCTNMVGTEVNVVVENGDMAVSCYGATDLVKLRQALEVLTGFEEWSARQLDLPSSEEVLSTELRLV